MMSMTKDNFEFCARTFPIGETPDEGFREWYERYGRASMALGPAQALNARLHELDVSPALETIDAPALVLNRRDHFLGTQPSRALVDGLNDAKYVELPGADHLFFLGDTLSLLDEVELFVTGELRNVESDRSLATVMFTDIVSSTERAAEMGDRRWNETLQAHDELIDRAISGFQGRRVKHTGDGVLATFDGPGRAVRCAQAIAVGVAALGIVVRAGLHTGEVQWRGEDVMGLAVNIAKRVNDMAAPGEVLVSSTVRDIVIGSQLSFDDRGTHDLKGVPDRWHIYAVDPALRCLVDLAPSPEKCDHGESMAKRAAFFDLDRTLLGDSSGIMVMDAMRGRGLISDRDLALADIGRRFFNVVGETWLGMQLTKRSLGRFAGWSRQDVRDAAERAIDKLDAAVYTEARELIERHKRDGDLVVIATSTGRDMVEAIADRLGVDRLIATEYEEDAQGVFTGNLIGKWLWGPDKAEAVKQFAEREGIDLDQSYAYSDSYFDRHLLEIVGYPRVVNPDAVMRAYAARKGWPVLGFKNREGPPQLALEPYDLLRPFAHPLIAPVNIVAEGVQLIPRNGPVILAANHRSYLDPIVLTAVGMRRGRKLRYLGKKEVFDAPVDRPGDEAARPDPRSTAGRATRRRCSRLSTRCIAERRSASSRRGRSRAARTFYEPKLQGEDRRRAARDRGRRPGRPGRAVGHGDGLAAQPAACRGSASCLRGVRSTRRSASRSR